MSTSRILPFRPLHVLLLAAVVVAGCDNTDTRPLEAPLEDLTGRYTLVTLDDQLLPVVTDTLGTCANPARPRMLFLERGELHLRADSTLTLSYHQQERCSEDIIFSEVYADLDGRFRMVHGRLRIQLESIHRDATVQSRADDSIRVSISGLAQRSTYFDRGFSALFVRERDAHRSAE